MNPDVLLFFGKKPEAIPLYEAVAGKIREEFGDFTIKVQKTQIAFSNRYNFAFVSLPIRNVRARPDVCIILTFGLSRQVKHPRIEISVEPYPNRWTHHVIIQYEDEVDGQIMEWIREAYIFSMTK